MYHHVHLQMKAPFLARQKFVNFYTSHIGLIIHDCDSKIFHGILQNSFIVPPKNKLTNKRSEFIPRICHIHPKVCYGSQHFQIWRNILETS